MKNYLNIDGWFNHERTYDFLVSQVPDNGIFIECGAWMGKSSAYLCDIARNRIKVYIVDTWKGSPNELETFHSLAKTQDIYSIFKQNMGSRDYTSLQMESLDASKQFKDESLDVVFIDMTHTYEAVKKDISYWLPKVKVSGYIAGHDYDDLFTGVKEAVNEEFKSISVMDGNCWIVKKEKI